MKNRTVIICLVLALAFFAAYLRTYMISLPTLDKLAKAEVYDNIMGKISKDMNEKYAILPKEKKGKAISNAYKYYLEENRYFIEDKIKEKSKEKKKFYQNPNGYTYMLGIDSYYWLRLIDNLINKGHIGDRIVDGQDYDDLVDMPIEKSLSRSMHLKLGYFIYKFFNLIKLNIDYNIGLYLIPILFSFLLVIFTFFITKLLSQSNSAAFFASIVVNLNPLLLQRSMIEWLDTDIYSVFFPLVIFGSFLFVFKSRTVIKKSLGLVAFAFACSIYASIWQGWWYIFDLLIVSGLVFILNDYSSEGKDAVLFRQNIKWLSFLFVSGIALVGLFNGRESFFSFIAEPFKLFFALKDVPLDNWPNVFLTVAELKKVSPHRIALELGGLSVFFITILGSIYFVIFKKIIRDKELGIGFFCLFIWIGVLYYTALTAVRFALLLIVPLGLMFGVVFDRIIRQVFSFSLKFSKKVRFSILGMLILLVYLFVFPFVSNSLKLAAFKFPIMNDAWDKSLSFIRDTSSKDAIINSWWDYGHWFTAVTKRKVLFDGKTQNSPVAFWMARVLTTDDEKKAIGILRMINISKNQAFDLLESYGFGHVKTINILEDVAKLSEEEARKHLGEFLEKEKIDKLIPLLFKKDMPEAYFIASYDMVTKTRSISHIGNWDFKKGDIWIKMKKSSPEELINYLQEEYKYTQEEAAKLWQDLRMLSERDAPNWISKLDLIDIESLSFKYKREGNMLMFDNGLALDLSNFNAYVFRGPGADIGIPQKVFYLKEGVLGASAMKDSNLDFSVLVYSGEEKDSYKSVFLNEDAASSIFTRMYFLKGEGLLNFKKILEEKTEDGNSVIVFKIIWPQ
jgi:dolichyl-diphosphooligosaccharide--protein glycosyltransferase